MSLFSNYQAKGQLKFFKSNDDDQKLNISIGISSNHEMNSNLYESISNFLETLLIGDYINEDTYSERKEHEKEEEIALKLHEKALKEQAKQQAKYMKEQEKLRKKTAKTTETTRKLLRSLHHFTIHMIQVVTSILYESI
ncbi:MAG: hypothetical protein EOO43_09860 [Flavobacterium sp.]|nr:MAG: hypothetical protein EOO43_09860 [Flavobacterium sp.]